MSNSSVKDFFLTKILDDLIREEKRGRQFFNDASKFVNDKRVKTLFERLAADENQHVEFLVSLKTEIKNNPEFRRQKQVNYDGKPVSMIDLSDMVMGYGDLPHLELFRANEFSKLMEVISVKEILKYAMKIEYENAKYLQKCLEATPIQHQKKLLKRLIMEEKNHFIALQRLCSDCRPEKD